MSQACLGARRLRPSRLRGSPAQLLPTAASLHRPPTGPTRWLAGPPARRILSDFAIALTDDAALLRLVRVDDMEVAVRAVTAAFAAVEDLHHVQPRRCAGRDAKAAPLRWLTARTRQHRGRRGIRAIGARQIARCGTEVIRVRIEDDVVGRPARTAGLASPGPAGDANLIPGSDPDRLQAATRTVGQRGRRPPGHEGDPRDGQKQRMREAPGPPRRVLLTRFHCTHYGRGCGRGPGALGLLGSAPRQTLASPRAPDPAGGLCTPGCSQRSEDRQAQTLGRPVTSRQAWQSNSVMPRWTSAARIPWGEHAARGHRQAQPPCVVALRRHQLIASRRTSPQHRRKPCGEAHALVRPRGPAARSNPARSPRSRR